MLCYRILEPAFRRTCCRIVTLSPVDMCSFRPVRAHASSCMRITDALFFTSVAHPRYSVVSRRGQGFTFLPYNHFQYHSLEENPMKHTEPEAARPQGLA